MPASTPRTESARTARAASRASIAITAATIAISITIAAGLAAARARADVAPPSPEELSCPRGAVPALPEVRPDALDPRGRPVRPWPYCAPSTCASDADCTDGRVCSTEEIGLCVQPHEVFGGEPVRSVRERPCEPDGTCLNRESTCERARRCIAPAATPTPEPPAADPAPATPPPPPASAEAPAAATTTTPTVATCACRATSPRSSRTWLAPLVALALALGVRRRR